MRRTAGILIFFLLFSIGTVSTSSSKGNYPAIHVEESLWEFGNVPFDYDMVHIYEVKNIGQSDLIISKVGSNCDCTTVRISDTLVPPGGSTQLRIDFWTTDYYGINTREVSIQSNDPEKPLYILEYSSDIGTVPRSIRAEPHALFFLPPEKKKKIKLINDTDMEIEFRLRPEIDSVFSIDRLEGTIGPKNHIIIAVTPKADIGSGTYFSSFQARFRTQREIITTIPIKIVRY